MNENLQERITQALSDYSERYRSGRAPSLALSEIYAFYPERAESKLTPIAWPGSYPNADESGVYLFFGVAEDLIYIGSAANLNNRVGSYFKYSNDGERRCAFKGALNTTPWYLMTIAVPESTKFEALSLEAFLINALSPKENASRFLWR